MIGDGKQMKDGYVFIFKKEIDGTYSYFGLEELSSFSRVNGGKFKGKKVDFGSLFFNKYRAGNVLPISAGNLYNLLYSDQENINFSSKKVVDNDNELCYVYMPKIDFDDLITKFRKQANATPEQAINFIKEYLNDKMKRIGFMKLSTRQLQFGLSNDSVMYINFYNTRAKEMQAEKAVRIAEQERTKLQSNPSLKESKKDISKPTKNIDRSSDSSVSEKNKMISVSDSEKDKIKTVKSGNKEIDVLAIINKLKGKVVGQDDTLESVVANMALNQMIISTGDKDKITSSKSTILLDGPTGTGKTFMLKSVAEELSLPIIIESANNFSPASYKGVNLSDMLVKLLRTANGDLELAQRGIIVLDEIDKLAANTHSDVSSKHTVQMELLTFLSGGTFQIEYDKQTVMFDTSNITFVGVGAFTKLREEKIANLYGYNKKNKMGFHDNNDRDNTPVQQDYYTITSDDYIKAGLERELVGRFTLFLSTQDLNPDKLEKIIRESSVSPLKGLKDLCAANNIEIIIDDNIISKIAQIAYVSGTGARAVNKIFNTLRDKYALDIVTRSTDRIVIDDEVLQLISDNDKRIAPIKKGSK